MLRICISVANNLLLALGSDAERRHGVGIFRLSTPGSATADVRRRSEFVPALGRISPVAAVVVVVASAACVGGPALVCGVAGLDPERALEHRCYEGCLADEDADAVLPEGPHGRDAALFQLCVACQIMSRCRKRRGNVH